MSRFTRALLGAAIAVAALPAAANAATVRVDTGKTGTPFRFLYLAAAGETNNLRVSQANDGTTFISDDAPIRISGDSSLDGCRLEADGDAVCAPNVFPFELRLGDGNDRVTYLGADSVLGGINGGDGNDTIFAGIRRGPSGQIAPGVLPISGGGGTQDKVSYALSQFAANVSLDDQPNDGTRISDENIKSDVEVVEGSDGADTITGSNGSEREIFIGGNGNDTINGLDGTDVFDEGSAPNGSDTYNGAGGIDLIDYSDRTGGVIATFDNLRNDGAPGEGDFLDQNVNDIFGGAGADTISGAVGRNVIFANGGSDTVSGADGDDELHGGTGVDTLFGGTGNDVVETVDNTADVIRCGTNSDTLQRDLRDVDATDCETVVSVGKLALAAKGASLRVSWTHPISWKQLRSVTVRIKDGRKVAGRIVIRPRAEKIAAAGKVEIARGRLTHRGGKVTARLKLRYDAALAGKVLKADVVAVDRNGAKQVERNAATIRVAR